LQILSSENVMAVEVQCRIRSVDEMLFQECSAQMSRPSLGQSTRKDTFRLNVV
jgi:hypothetical protein